MSNEPEESRTDQSDEFPEWLPDEYDPDAPLRERLPIMADIDGGIEIQVGDDRGIVEVVGQPKELNDVQWEDGKTLTLKAGHRSEEWLWSYELVVPASGEPFLRDVDPEQDIEAYQRTKKTILDDVDARIYGIDHERLESRTEADA